MRHDARIFVGQKALIRRAGSVLILNDPNYGLDFPGGKVQEGEINLHVSLRREVLEETNLEINIGFPFFSWMDEVHPLYVLTGTPVMIIAYDADYVSGEVRLSEEHNGFRWLSAPEVQAVNDGSPYFAALERFIQRFALSDHG